MVGYGWSLRRFRLSRDSRALAAAGENFFNLRKVFLSVDADGVVDRRGDVDGDAVFEET